MAQTDGICKIEGCEKQRFRREMCSMHYSRLQRYGDLEAVHKPGEPRSLGACSVGGCGRSAVARDLCGKHYQRWKKSGDPLIVKLDRNRTDQERFWSFVNKEGPEPACRPGLGSCWLWTGGTSDGYGMFSMGGRNVHAHIVSFTWARGEIPAGWERDHLCRVRHCVRPEHMEAVPHQVNVQRGVSPWAACEHGSSGSFDRSRGGRICEQCAQERRVT